MSKRKPKQVELPTLEKPRNKLVETAADKYVAIRDERMALTKREVEAAAELLAILHGQNLTAYSYDDNVVTIEPKEKVRVRKPKEETYDDDDDDD